MFSEAQTYCFSAANAINTNRANSSTFQNFLDAQIAQVKQSEAYQSISYKELISVVCNHTKSAVENDGDTLEDVNSVAWHLGILCFIHRNACPATNQKFDELFIDCWEKLKSGTTNINAAEILTKAFKNLLKRHGNITVSMIETEVINQACLWIITNHQSNLVTTADVSQIDFGRNLQFHEIANTFVDAAAQLFPDHYTEKEMGVAIPAILQNISWSGMWDHLCKYYLSKHGIQLDSSKGDDEFIIFNSVRHDRFEHDQFVNGSDVERVIELNFTYDKKRLYVSIEPTLSGKPGNLISREGNALTYQGDDPDFEFTVYFDEFEEVEKFILHRTDRNLQLVYI